MLKKVLLLLLLTTAIETAYVGAYHYQATGPLQQAIAEHSSALVSGVIPPADSINIQTDTWVRVAHFESSFGQVQLIIDMFMGLLVAYVLIMGGVSAALAKRSREFSPNIHISRGLYLIMLIGVTSFINIPLSVSGFIIESLRGTSILTIDYALFMFVQDFFLGIVFTLLPFIPLYWIMDRYKKWWWAVGAGFMALFTLFTAYVGPILIDPLYFELRPLENKEVQAALSDVAAAAGVPPDRIFISDASTVTFESNAMVTGLGSTKRVILDDTLLTFYTPREIRVIVAHELGHYVLGHLWYDMAIMTALTFVFFFLIMLILRWMVARYGSHIGVYRVNDIVLFPIFSTLLFLIPSITAPIESNISRVFEHQADVYETEIAKDPQASIDGFKKMAYQSFVDVDPPPLLQWWFGTHPTILERIEYYESQK